MTRTDLKVVLLGHAAVGKSSLMERFVNERFNENLSYQNTIGAAFAAKQIQIDGKNLVMDIWDTAGSERYDAMTKIYYRGAKAAIVCYDVTKPHTFQKAKFWIRELRTFEEGCKVYICATKRDILELGTLADPDISIVEIYASGVQAKFFLTSSKTGENVVELFHQIAEDFMSCPENIQKFSEGITLTGECNARKKFHCCIR